MEYHEKCLLLAVHVNAYMCVGSVDWLSIMGKFLHNTHTECSTRQPTQSTDKQAAMYESESHSQTTESKANEHTNFVRVLSFYIAAMVVAGRLLGVGYYIYASFLFLQMFSIRVYCLRSFFLPLCIGIRNVSLYIWLWNTHRPTSLNHCVVWCISAILLLGIVWMKTSLRDVNIR